MSLTKYINAEEPILMIGGDDDHLNQIYAVIGGLAAISADIGAVEKLWAEGDAGTAGNDSR
jgi:hypothetical protein